MKVKQNEEWVQCGAASGDQFVSYDTYLPYSNKTRAIPTEEMANSQILSSWNGKAKLKGLKEKIVKLVGLNKMPEIYGVQKWCNLDNQD